MAVIDCSATAATLVPGLERRGAQVTMLQRSPTYLAPMATVDTISGCWRKVLPEKTAYPVARLNHAFRVMPQPVIGRRGPWLCTRALRRMQRPYLDAALIEQHSTPQALGEAGVKAPDGISSPPGR